MVHFCAIFHTMFHTGDMIDYDTVVIHSCLDKYVVLAHTNISNTIRSNILVMCYIYKLHTSRCTYQRTTAPFSICNMTVLT
jgi:hypothetical protein